MVTAGGCGVLVGLRLVRDRVLGGAGGPITMGLMTSELLDKRTSLMGYEYSSRDCVSSSSLIIVRQLSVG